MASSGARGGRPAGTARAKAKASPGMFRHGGARTERIVRHIRERAAMAASRRRAFDAAARERLFRPLAIVFTDTADFTVRTARDGILHFLMIFDRAVRAVEPEVVAHGGTVVKVEGDSLLLRFPDVVKACDAVDAMDDALRLLNKGRPEADQLRFSYGIGAGEVLELDDDLFGLEVNLASKIGEDLALPGEALLTAAAAQALPEDMLRRVVPHRIVTFEDKALPVHRLRLRRG